MRLITTNDIENWGNTTDCQYNLPHLIRKLIIILNKLNTEIDFYLDEESKTLLEHLRKLIKYEKIDKEDKVFILFNLIDSYRG